MKLMKKKKELQMVTSGLTEIRRGDLVMMSAL
jgi:hypothetical protein